MAKTKRSKAAAPQTTNGKPGEPVNKSEKVREALRAHRKATPTAISEMLNEQGVPVTPNFVSQIKSMVKKGKGKPGRKPGRKPGDQTATSDPSVSSVIRAVTSKTRSGGGLSVEEVIQLRALAQRLGSEELKKVVEAVGG